MALQEKKHNFKTVRVLKDQTLGIGSYGKVCKARCDDLLCAAKLIHETLFDPTAQYDIAPQREHRLPIRRFEQECEFLSTLRHPNIIQYLGVHQDADTSTPVLLMELMDESLTHFLETASEPTPYHIQINLCHDISLALSFLHSNNITHRDLSSNNVLLISNVRAKVTDFGMARLNLPTVNTHLTFTMCPGTDVYMPPEAVDDNAVYTEKIDCFSYGVIAIQILTHKFPKPGSRKETVQINHPRFPGGTVQANVPEVDRRQNHISEIDPKHPLLSISLNCLEDNAADRPSAQELCHRLAALKRSSSYSESALAFQEETRKPEHDTKIVTTPTIREQHQFSQQIRDLQRILEQQSSRLRGKDGIIEERDQIIAAEQQRNQLLREQIIERDRQISEKDQQIRGKDIQLGNAKEQLKVSEEIIAQFEKRVHELEQLLRLHIHQKRHDQPHSQYLPRSDHPKTDPQAISSKLSLRWRGGERAPCVMNRGCDAIASGVFVYCRQFRLKRIYLLNTADGKWFQLLECQYRSFSMAFVNGTLTTIGGGNDLEFYGLPAVGGGSYTNKLIVLLRKEALASGRRYSHLCPPSEGERLH